MPAWKISDIAQTVGALNDLGDEAEHQVTSVSFDTRKLQPNALFVPLIADNDGHDYINQAVEKGAAAAFWSRDLADAPEGILLIEVEDTHEALKSFAKNYLKEVHPKVVGITGSNGKTTTKDMTAAVLATTYRTHKTEGNFNNDIGLPITILQMPRDTEAIVLEMGMNHPHEISELSRLAEPDIAVITMIGESHIEFFESRDGIAAAKFEIIDGLKNGGELILNGDEELLTKRLEESQSFNRLTFGQGRSNALYPLFIESSMKKTKFSTNLEPKTTISIPLPGEYNVNNALAAMAVGLALDVTYEKIVKALSEFELTAHRLEWVLGFNQSQMLNDAYNASPTSMKASISSFLNLDNLSTKWLVLGDMGELGTDSRRYHRELASVIEVDQVDHVLLYGELMKELYDELEKDPDFQAVNVHHIEGDLDQLIDYLKDNIQPKDHLLFKSSFSTNLIQVVEALKI